MTVIAVALAAYETANWLAVYWGEMMMSPMSAGATRYPYDHLPLPSVTLCPRTISNATAPYMEYNQRLYAFSLALPSANPDILAAVNEVRGWTESTFNDIRTRFRSTLDSQAISPVQVYLNLGYQCRGFVQSCKLGRRVFDCCQDSFLVSSYFGPCVTLRPNMFQTHPGIQNKLEIRLQLDSQNFQKFPNGSFTGYPGFWMFLDADGYYMGDPSFIRLGYDTYVTVRSKPEGHMSPPWTHLPFNDRSCSVAFRDFRPQFDSSNNFLEANNDELLRQQNVEKDRIDACRRQCALEKIFALCSCYPFGLLSTSAQLSSKTFCDANMTNSCAEPLLNGTQLLPQWLTGTGGPLLLYCDTQCPSMCGAERAVTINMKEVELHASFYPEISTYSMASAAVINIYYSRLDYTNSPPPDLNLYFLLREIGLTLVMWLAAAALLVLMLIALRALLCCSCFKCPTGKRFNNAVDPHAHAGLNGHNVEMRQMPGDAPLV